MHICNACQCFHYAFCTCTYIFCSKLKQRVCLNPLTQGTQLRHIHSQSWININQIIASILWQSSDQNNHRFSKETGAIYIGEGKGGDMS